MHFEYSAKAQDYIVRIKEFMRLNVEPYEQQIYQDMHKLNPGGDWQNWKLHPKVEECKQLAKEQGLWNHSYLMTIWAKA